MRGVSIRVLEGSQDAGGPTREPCTARHQPPGVVPTGPRRPVMQVQPQHKSPAPARCPEPHRGPCWAGTWLDVDWAARVQLSGIHPTEGTLPGAGSRWKGSQWPRTHKKRPSHKRVTGDVIPCVWPMAGGGVTSPHGLRFHDA